MTDALIKPTASRGLLPFGAGLGWREAQPKYYPDF